MEIKGTAVKKLYPPRPRWSWKGCFGKLLIIGGSKQYSGSPALAGLAALKAGVDLVTIAAPARAADIIASFGPNLITYPLKGDSINFWHLGKILNLSKDHDAVVLGGGLGRAPQTFDFVRRFLKEIKTPCVIDADALYSLPKNEQVLRPNFILTPHAHEFFVLSGKRPSRTIGPRTKLLKSVAKKLNTTILLKGPVDLISDGKNVIMNKTGNSFMTKGGTGDTLAGIIGALLARKATPLTAAGAGAWINGAAGNLAAQEFGESLFASDIINKIHSVLKWQK